MLQRRTYDSGVVVYASALLGGAGVPHGFSTRLGGVSPPPFQSLNLGNPAGCAQPDSDERISENYRRLLSAIGCGGRRLCRVHQVHGAAVHEVNSHASMQDRIQADAIITSAAGVVLSIRVADCVPVLLASKDGRHVAAVHAGWRGAIAGVIPAAVQTMTARGAAPKSLLAAVGPCIGFDAFEVGPEVLNAFQTRFPQNPPIRRLHDGKGRVDLRRAVRDQLGQAGLPPDQIDTTDRCTYHHDQEFFSHRRDRGLTGRMAAVISTAP